MLSLPTLLAGMVHIASRVVRNLAEDVTRRLRGQAARCGRSTEAGVRQTLEEPVGRRDGRAEALMGTFGEPGGVEFDLPARAAQPRPLDFDNG
jgi:plasmid stability protein